MTIPNALRPSGHLMSRLEPRGVSWSDVVATITGAEVSWRGHHGRTVYQAGDLAVVVTPDLVVLTVLLRSEAQWNDDMIRARASA